MARILAIDSGLTVTKAVIFDIDGRQLAVSRCNIAQEMPKPRHVERDMTRFWHQTASAIRAVLEQSNTSGKDVLAVAATAHGDGVYLLDKQGDPLGAGILSLDSRAGEQIRHWAKDGTFEKSLSITGQIPHVSAPSALLAWMRVHEPERFARIGHILACKDWLRYCLTGTIGTDRTEASTSFTDYKSQRYSPDAMKLFGLSGLSRALPDIAGSCDIVGEITPEAATLTGLQAGTPVAAGLHDVTASALGVGAHKTGVIGVVAGTYSINECVSQSPKTGEGWFCRNAIEAGRWNNMSISPASSTNYDWFLDTLCAAEKAQAEAQGQSIHSLLAPEIDAALQRASSVLYHPFLFGSPHGASPSAGFIGLRGWHNRGDMLAALLEGIAFNHRHHVDMLRGAFTADEVILTGGVSRNPAVAQLFADILDMPVTVSQTDEAAAWGAALCAGAAIGAFERLDADPRDLSQLSETYTPALSRAAHYQTRYDTYQAVSHDMMRSWERLNALDTQNRG